MAEEKMLKDPYYVFFASETVVDLKFNYYPCLIYSSSKVLARVKKFFIAFLPFLHSKEIQYYLKNPVKIGLYVYFHITLRLNSKK
jgi:hypothetical protein